MTQFERVSNQDATFAWSVVVCTCALPHLLVGSILDGGWLRPLASILATGILLIAWRPSLRRWTVQRISPIGLIAVEGFLVGRSFWTSYSDLALLLVLPAAIAIAFQLLCLTLTHAGLSPARALIATLAGGLSMLVSVVVIFLQNHVPEPPFEIFWAGGSDYDPDLTYRYRPGTVFRQYYPDNPRNYFHVAPPVSLELEKAWRLDACGLNAVELRFPQEPSGVIRVDCSSRSSADPGVVRLYQPDLDLLAIAPITVSFLARSVRPASLHVAWTEDVSEIEAKRAEWAVDTNSVWQRFRWETSLPKKVRSGSLVFEVEVDAQTADLSNVEIMQEDRRITPTSSDRNVTPFSVEYRTNDGGFRDVNHAIDRPEDTFRIAVLGDSFTFGFGVHADDVFSHRLETLLNHSDRDGPRVEVLNFGMPAYSTREERVLFERVVQSYCPNLVLLVMCWNDDMSYAEELRLRRAKVTAPVRLARLLPYLSKAVAPKGDFIESADEIETLNQRCIAINARLAVVLFRVDTDNPGWPRLLAAVPPRLEQIGVPLLDLGSDFGNRADDDLLAHRCDSHPSELAHKIAAEVIEDFLQSNSLIR